MLRRGVARRLADRRVRRRCSRPCNRSVTRGGSAVHLTPVESGSRATPRASGKVPRTGCSARGLGPFAHRAQPLSAHLHGASSREARGGSGSPKASHNRDWRRLPVRSSSVVAAAATAPMALQWAHGPRRRSWPRHARGSQGVYGGHWRCRACRGAGCRARRYEAEERGPPRNGDRHPARYRVARGRECRRCRRSPRCRP